MAMPKRGKPATATELSAARDELKGDISGLRDELKGDIAGLRDELKGDIVGLRDELKGDLAAARAEAKQDSRRIAAELQDRPTRTEMERGFSTMNAKLDRIVGVVDRIAGENYDVRRTLTVFDAMFADNRRMLESHERRLSAIETRLPPTAP